jgi:hypothetical protein
MIRSVLLFTSCAMAAAVAVPNSAVPQQNWYEKAVKKVDGAFTPAEAKPGQTVTFSITVELKPGYHTYPTTQTDKGAANMINEIKFPDPGEVIFVGAVQDPKDQKSKAEPVLGITDLKYCTGTVVYTRKAIVSPKARPGSVTVKLPAFNLNVCNEDNCFPTKKVPVEAALKVLDGPAAPVEAQYADEVKKALGGK